MYRSTSALIMFLFASLLASNANAQTPIHQQFYDLFDTYKESSITDRYSKHADIEPLILSLSDHADFIVQKEGESVEGRPIYLVKWGNGPKTVFMWSQMHGNEPTATMALMDIFNFLKDDEHADVKRRWSDEMTLLFVPLVNPDGAEVYKRRNALDVDLNRDALRLTNPESQILKNVRDRYDAMFGFNLHDQSVYYGTGEGNNEPVAIAFLAPAYNVEKDTNPVRQRAKQLIGVLNQDLKSYIPGKIARFDDTFEPRAFGDNMQRWGTSTILIESGGYDNDSEKQYLRKLHFMMLLSSFEYISAGKYESVAMDEYLSIPMNRFNNVFSYVLRNGSVVHENNSYVLDLAFRVQEVMNDEHVLERSVSRISDVGDVSTFGSYEEFDADGFTIKNMMEFPEIFPNVEAVMAQDWKRLLRQGYGYFRVYGLDRNAVLRESAGMPFRVLLENQRAPAFPAIGEDVALFIEHEDGRQYVFANGKMMNITE